MEEESKKKYFAFAYGGDTNQRFYAAEDLGSPVAFSNLERKWLQESQPGDSLVVTDGGYFPGGSIVIRLSGNHTVTSHEAS